MGASLRSISAPTPSYACICRLVKGPHFLFVEEVLNFPPTWCFLKLYLCHSSSLKPPPGVFAGECDGERWLVLSLALNFFPWLIGLHSAIISSLRLCCLNMQENGLLWGKKPLGFFFIVILYSHYCVAKLRWELRRLWFQKWEQGGNGSPSRVSTKALTWAWAEFNFFLTRCQFKKNPLKGNMLQREKFHNLYLFSNIFDVMPCLINIRVSIHKVIFFAREEGSVYDRPT